MKTNDANSKNALRIVIAGGSGALGRSLIRLFPDESVRFVVLSRKYDEVIPGARVVYWSGTSRGAWTTELEGADVLINLSGRSVDCRYTEKNRSDILNSRIEPTETLGLAVSECKTPPRLWINAGSATIYRHAEDREMEEDTGEYGTGFSVGICEQWEQAFDHHVCPLTRKIVLRISMVMGRDHGVLPVLTKLARKGLGGTMGSGRQYMSWIHELDFARIIQACIEQESWSGIINCSSPEPCTNKDFMKLVRKAVGSRIHVRTPSWMLEIGAFFMHTETELVLKSRRVVSSRLRNNGFVFQFPSAAKAVADLT